MAIKKYDLFRSIWASCDKRLGGMDAMNEADINLPSSHPPLATLISRGWIKQRTCLAE
ncbi:MAG: hypothetical protein R3D69_00055 [Xanthobacteraceae bacterium]